MTSERHRPLRLGTRGSPLALAQASQIARQLHEQCGRTAVLVTVPAPAQGVLAVECRTDDPVTAAQISILDHPPTRAAAGAGDALGRQLAQTLLQEGGAALLRRSQYPHDQERRQLMCCHPAGQAVH
jgi:porphobilinogen deaminase